MRMLAVLTLVMPAVAVHAQPAHTARGTVFIDRDGDAVLSDGDGCIAGVRVSNGRDVVRTDSEGRYELPIDDDDIVFVVKPRGYQVPIDVGHLPRFYYIHKPAGSPDDTFRYPGVEPTGPLPESIDFPLVKYDGTDRFRVIVLGDTQPFTIEQVDLLSRDAVPQLLDETNGDDPPAFVISLGDIVGDHLDLYEPLNEVMSTLGVPIYNVMGNHDQNYMSPDDAHSDETFERVFGPTTYAFQYGRAHFIILDDIIWNGYKSREDKGDPEPGNYIGGLRDDQLDFIENYLNTLTGDELVVLCMHIPLVGGGVQQVPQRGRLFELLSRFPRTLSLSGHTHVQQHKLFGPDDGYDPGEPGQFGITAHHHFNAATVSGSWYRGAPDEYGIPHTTMRFGAPNGFNILSVDSDEYEIDFFPARYPASFQISIYAPSAIAAGTPEAEVVANVFAGDPLTRVAMRLRRSDGEATRWIPMAHDVRPDPFYLAVKAAEDSEDPPNGRPMPAVLDSQHIWVGALPAGLEPGAYTIEVEAVNMFKRKHTARCTLRVTD